MDRRELEWLARAARSCHRIVEVGSYQGRSARALADNCPGVVVCIDPWDGYANDDGSQARWIRDLRVAHEAFRANLQDHLASGRVVEIQATLERALPRLADLGFARAGQRGIVDLVFIDGDHRYEAVMSDISIARALLKPGGVISGHDLSHKSWPGVKRAVDEVFGSRYQVCKSIWWTTVPA